MFQPLLGHPEAIVDHLDDRVAVIQDGPDRNAAAADFSRQPMLDRILDERLQDHARHDRIERRQADLFVDLQLRSEADDLDVEVLVDRFQLFAQRDEMVRAAHQTAEQARQLHDQHPRRRGARTAPSAG